MTQVEAESAHEAAGCDAPHLDMRLEVVLVPISEEDRESEFHLCLEFWLSADFGVMENHQMVRFPPTGSATSASTSAGLTSGRPGTLDGLTLVVSGVADALNELVRRGVRVGEVQADDAGVFDHDSGVVRVVGIDLGKRSDPSMAL